MRLDFLPVEVKAVQVDAVSLYLTWPVVQQVDLWSAENQSRFTFSLSHDDYYLTNSNSADINGRQFISL